jgi:uncharacterized membrane protein YtjA (UPF0391 family)
LTGFIRRYPEAIFRGPPAILFRQLGKFPGFAPRNHRFRGGLFRHEQARSFSRADRNQRGRVMLSWVVTFLVVALIAGILGFGGIAGASVEIAKAIFFIAIILFLVSAVVGLVRGRTRV